LFCFDFYEHLKWLVVKRLQIHKTKRCWSSLSFSCICFVGLIKLWVDLAWLEIGFKVGCGFLLAAASVCMLEKFSTGGGLPGEAAL
jgi:hypothetical protein